jgi:hypothetical protein
MLFDLSLTFELGSFELSALSFSLGLCSMQLVYGRNTL